MCIRCAWRCACIAAATPPFTPPFAPRQAAAVAEAGAAVVALEGRRDELRAEQVTSRYMCGRCIVTTRPKLPKDKVKQAKRAQSRP